MRRSLVVIILSSFLLVLSYGCAQKDYVQQQIEPLVDRINKLEDCCKDCCAKGAAAKPEATSEKAEAAADRAEAAAKKAEAAAKKAEKAFELQQKK